MSATLLPTCESAPNTTGRSTRSPAAISPLTTELIGFAQLFEGWSATELPAGSGQDGSTERRTASDRSAALVHEWQSIAANDPSVLIEMHPELVLSSAQNANTSSSNGVGSFLWRCTSHDALDDAAALALLIEKTVSLPIVRGIKGRLQLRGLRLAGSRIIGGQAAKANANRAECEAVVARELVRNIEQLLSKSSGPSCLLLEDLSVDSPLWSAFDRVRGVRVVTLAEPQTRWVLRFPESADAYWKRFSSKTRYNFRRQKRLLEHTWEVIEREEQVDQFLADAAVVSANSWQGKRIGLRVSTQGSLADQCRQLARLGALRCYLLRSKGEPIAFAVGTQWNGRFSLEEIGYDTRYAEFSPGTVLLLNMLDDMFARECPTVLDFGFGDGAYKQLFGTDSTTSGTRLVVSRRLVPALKLTVNRAGAWLEDRLRSLLQATGLTTKLRRFYRGAAAGTGAGTASVGPTAAKGSVSESTVTASTDCASATSESCAKPQSPKAKAKSTSPKSPPAQPLDSGTQSA